MMAVRVHQSIQLKKEEKAMYQVRFWLVQALKCLQSMKKKLYEVAVLININDDRVLFIPPIPVMAIDEESAKYKAAAMALAKDHLIDSDDYTVLVRLFQQG